VLVSYAISSDREDLLTSANKMNQSSHPQHLEIFVRVQTRSATRIQDIARKVPLSALMSSSLLASIEYWGIWLMAAIDRTGWQMVDWNWCWSIPEQSPEPSQEVRTITYIRPTFLKKRKGKPPYARNSKCIYWDIENGNDHRQTWQLSNTFGVLCVWIQLLHRQ